VRDNDKQRYDLISKVRRWDSGDWLHSHWSRLRCPLSSSKIRELVDKSLSRSFMKVRQLNIVIGTCRNFFYRTSGGDEAYSFTLWHSNPNCSTWYNWERWSPSVSDIYHMGVQHLMISRLRSLSKMGRNHIHIAQDVGDNVISSRFWSTLHPLGFDLDI